jgi:hypothetical protein
MHDSLRLLLINHFPAILPIRRMEAQDTAQEY